ncbi:MAG: DNA topoisomerase 4 subunit A [Clostridiales bacterium]|nr:DNA topoisomerase 4 subunit A [Clostridiales bacterium]
MENEKGIIFSSIDEVLKNSMIPYAENVILDRALPRVEDGLKPVQRRILYAMYEMGLTPDKPHKKCAKIVGEVLGKYHPHGDSSVYGALVHLAQDFNMRMPLIDGQGNFGTVDGDSAAAYRYTEARMQALSLELLQDIDKDTVNFSLNFSDELEEPDTLPGKFPNLLVNGATGIAVGLATNIPPHNLVEVINGTIAYIDNPKISLKEMMNYIKAPDFPTGGYIVAGDELTEAYKTGKGKIKIKARVTVEKDTGDKQNLIISELPYQVNKATLLKKIADLKEDKKELLGGIADVVDESDRNGMRAVIKLKKDADAKAILAYLYKNTDLETSFGINMVAIANGKPCQLGLLEIISYYVNYQREVILRRSKFELERAKERAHVLEGLIVAVKNIDEVIKIIKNAENTADARAKLRARFDLTEVQASAILDLRLARLTKLEVNKLEEELKELKKKMAELTEIIASKAKQMHVVKTELNAIKKKHGDDRRSNLIIGGAEMDIQSVEKELKQVDDFVVAFTEGKSFKKMTEKNFKMSDKTVKDNSVADDFIKIMTRAKSDKTLLAFTNLGNCCKIDMEVAPECRFRDKGAKFNAVAKEAARNEYPIAFFEVDENNLPDGYLLFFTKDGLIKKTEWKEYNLLKPYYQAIKLKDGDELIAVENDLKETTIAFVTEQGLSLNALKDDIPVQGRVAGGVKGINLNKGDSIKFVSQIDDEGEFVIVTDCGFYKRVLAAEIEPMARYRKGIKICELGKEAKVVYAGYVKEPFDIAVIDTFGVAFTVNTEDLSIEGRTTKGKTLKNENKKRYPEKVFKLFE